MAKKNLVHFYGLALKENKLIGYVRSEEFVSQIDENWIPWYQRGRVNRQQKIEDLKEIFKTGGSVPAVKINFIGHVEKFRNEALLEGEFHIIDGQQRLMALKDSGIKDAKVGVEMYLNLTMEQEIDLFHQQVKQSNLTFGDLAKSSPGIMGEIVKRWLADRRTAYAIKITVNDKSFGLNLSVVAPIFAWIYKRIVKKEKLVTPVSGKEVLVFFDTVTSKSDANMSDYALKQLLVAYVKIFGEFDPKSLAYRRPFVIAVCNVIINYFMSDSGNIHWGVFKDKAEGLPNLLKNSRVRELLSTSGSKSVRAMHDILLHYFNSGKRKSENRLTPVFKDSAETKQMAMDVQ